MRGVHDQMSLALAAEGGVGDAEQGQARVGGIGGDGLVAQVEAEPAGARVADDPRQ